MSPRTLHSPVAIVGGGPVGLMLALFLDRHGVESVVFNLEEATRWDPKGSTHNSRTMEHYRRIGIGARVRRLGLPEDHPTDVVYLTRFNGREIARLAMQSSAERMRGVMAAPCNHQNFEPLHRANQMYVERLDVVDVPDPDARDLYGRDLALIRPDQHICWRGDRLPDDCTALIAKVVGAD